MLTMSCHTRKWKRFQADSNKPYILDQYEQHKKFIGCGNSGLDAHFLLQG